MKEKKSIFRSYFTLCDSRGLTFLELIFVISIFGILSGVILFKFGDFTADVNFQNLAQDIALRITQAQRSAISGTENANTYGGVVPSYGVYFEADPSATAANNKHFVYFFDLGEDGLYDTFGPSCGGPLVAGAECIQDTTITTGAYISNICATNYNGQQCGYSGVNVTFKRPFPDARMRVLPMQPSSPTEVQIELTSPTGAQKTIFINSVGHVEVLDGGVL